MKFNFAPYNDTFTIKDNHYKVLYKPGYYVQSRELNTTQSIIQNQIASIGNHLFKNGAKITGCSTAFVQYDYVRLNDQYNSIDVVLKPFNSNKIKLIGVVSGVEARIFYTTEKTNTDAPVLFVIYTKTGSDAKQSTFIPGEDVQFYDENDVLVYTTTVRCPSCPDNVGVDNINPIGKSLFFNIEEGKFFYNGYFVYTDTQFIITEKYLTKDLNGNIESNLTYRVGLDVVEEIVTCDDDESLYDNSLGYPNYAAPGADRYKISLYLAIKDYVDNGDESNFITLAKVRQNQTVEYKKDETEYSQIMDEIARRTYETSGDFTVNAWKVTFLNEKKKNPSDSLGWSLNGSDDNYVAVISPGTGYVKGYRISTTNDTVVQGRKARDTKKIRGSAINIEERANITVTSSNNISWINHNGSSTLSNQIFNFVDSGSNTIGSFKVYDIRKTSANTYKLYIHSITLLPNKNISMVDSVKTADNSFVGTTPNIVLQNSNNTSLLFDTKYKSLKSIRDNNNSNNGNTSVSLRTRLFGVLDGSGSITFTASTNQSFVSPLTAGSICWVGTNPTGISIALTSSNTSNTATTLTLNLGTTYAGQNVTLITSILKTAQKENTKTLTRHVLTTNAKPASGINTTIILPHADGYYLESIKLINIVDQSINTDITHEYEFNNGQTDNYYTNAYLRRLNTRAFGNDDRLIITYTYFEHSGSAGFFTVDSYDQLINDPDLDLEYSDIPIYKDSLGVSHRLSEVIDFRSINLSNTVNVNASIPEFGTNIIFDAEYYLPRSDLLLVNTRGIFYIKEGIPSENPTLPECDRDAMILYEIHLGDYTYDLNDIKIKYVDNRRYSMKDIGKFENRLSNLEYAVSLSLLEQQTLNMSIKDQNGLDRYKNGFLVDNYSTFNGVNILSSEFKASLNRQAQELRPQFKQNNIRLKFDSSKSTNIKRFGNMALSQYDHDLFIQNPYATQSLSINPYMIFRRNGSMTLSPNIDTWADDQYLPRVVTNIDTGVDALRQVAEASDLLGVDYSSWIDYNISVMRDNSTSSVTTRDSSNINTTTTSINTTTTTTQSLRTATTTSIGSRTQSYNIDDVVKDVSIIPYIRSRIVQFYATNLKPNTQMYAYFDGQDVTRHCKKITQITSSGDVLVNRAASVFGAAPLITDNDGNLTGEFRIPENTFFTGEKKFVLTNDPLNSGNPDVETSRCESTYFAGGVSQTKQTYTMNVISPTFNQSSVVESRTSTNVSREVNTSTVTTPIPAPPIMPAPARPPMPTTRPPGNWSSAWHWVWTGQQWSWDPIAQGFSVDESCFISKVGVYFANVDTNADIIWFEIRELVNGYPSKESISRKEIKSTVIAPFATADASKEFSVEFSCPVYVDSSKSYAFVIGGFSPETRVYISTLGNQLLGQPNNVLEQPPLKYTMFRSLNGETWNAQQFDTMKINLYRCVFDMSPTTYSFYAENSEAFNTMCDDAPIEVQTGSNKVRIYCKNHSLRNNDRVVLEFGSGSYYKIEVTSGMPQIGQPISTVTGSGYISDIKILPTLNFYEISIKDMIGHFNTDQQFTCEARPVEYRDWFLISDTGASGVPITQNQSLGFVRDISISGVPTNISGADISLFAKEHIVRTVDSMDSFIIEVEGTFTSSGRFGGGNVKLQGHNIKYDIMNIAGQYLSYNTNESWSATTYNKDGYFNNPIDIKSLNDIYLENPSVLLSSKNEIRILGNSDKSFTLNVTTTPTSPYISSVFNTDSFSITTISNRIEWIDTTIYNQAPNDVRYISETNPKNGSQTFKSVTSKVLLQNPASDMRIIFDVYCSQYSDFDVYVKLMRAQSGLDENNILWTKLDNINKIRNSSGITDIIEYDLNISKCISTWDVSTEYISFIVKLVGKSKNSCHPVWFKNFRAIAIT